MKKEYSLSNIIAYIEGNIRYKLYYSKNFKWLIRKHILEQIEYRIRFMDNECYLNGQCKMCGCETTALQMANKSCDKPCYPVMMKKEIWDMYKIGVAIIKDHNGLWDYKPKTQDNVEQVTLHSSEDKGVLRLFSTDKKELAKLYKAKQNVAGK